MDVFKQVLAQKQDPVFQSFDKDALYEAFSLLSTSSGVKCLGALDVDYYELEDTKNGQYFSIIESGAVSANFMG